MNKLNDILAALRERGIRLWLEEGKLRFQGPEGSMSAELRERLLAHKEEVMAFLAASAAAAAAPVPLAVRRDGALPLSSMQSRMLFVDEMGADKAAYNLPLALELRGALDVAALQASLNALVARHESLRSRFVREGGHFRLVVDTPAPLALTLEDVPADALTALCLAEAAEPFTLDGGALLRARLCRVADGHHVLLLTMHHIISDGWSIGVMLRDLGLLYGAQGSADGAGLAPLTLQYVDFAQWQADTMASAAMQAQETYWGAKLAGAAPLLNLPTDHVRPAVQSMAGRTERFSVPPALHARLAQFCQDAGVTPYSVLLAAFQCLLARYAGQADVSVGIASANRRHELFEPVVGMFMNTLVLRGQLAPGANFRQVLAQAHAGVLEAQENQDVAFERLVEIVQPERSLSYAPLFQVMMMYQDAPVSAPAFGALDARVLTLDSAISKYDLTLSFERGAHGLEGGIEYCSALFEPATIVRMHGHYLQLLGALLEQPERNVAEHALLTAAEFDLMTRAWNATELAYQAVPVFDAIERQASQTPSEVALVFAGQSLDYAALLAQVGHVAAHLQDAGVAAGDRIGIFMDRSAHMVVAMLAVLKSGAAYVPLDPAYPRERLRYICDDAGLSLCLTQSFLLADSPHPGLTMLALDNLLADGHQRSAPSAVVAPDQAAYMIYTSGSTGHPKGVQVSHRNVANLFAALDLRLGQSQQRPCWLAVTSISFDISVLELLWTLSRGHKVVLQPGQVPPALAAAQAGGAKGELDFSLFYFASDSDACPDNRYRVLLDGARFADQNGFKAVWVPERHFHAFGGQYPSPSVAAAAIAAITTNVQVRAGSVVLPLHDPIRIAEEWSMVDNLSAGRVGIAFASGWHFDDFVFFPERFETRHQFLRDGIDTVRKLWRGESIVRQGGTGKDVIVTTRPRPVQAALPVWITAAASPETFRYAGEIGANVLTHLLGQNLEELGEKIAMYRRTLAEHGHCPQAGQVTLMMHTFIGEDIDAVRAEVEKPFKDYLRSSVNLLRPVAASQGLDPDIDLEAVVDASFERYFGTSALFGTPRSCLDLVAKIRAIGVTEVACLVDFGVPVDTALGGLTKLAELKEMSNSVSARLRHFELANRQGAAELVREHGVTHVQSTPSFAAMLLDQLGPQTAGIAQWLVGGEPLPQPLAERILQAGCGQLHNMYGPTETTVWSSSAQFDGDAVTLGRPLANTRVYVLDAQLLPVPVGVPGELYIAGDGVSQGYWQRAQLTAENFMPDPFSGAPGARMYRTGDLARFAPDGQLQFMGRNDGQIKLRGFRIELGEVASLLRQQDGVQEATVRLLPGSGAHDAQLVAYVVAHKATASQAPAEHGVQRFQFPDGTAVFHTDEAELDALYRHLFEQRAVLQHGVALDEHACVFDVAAGVGAFSVFAQLNCSNPLVYAFEPTAPAYAALHSNMQWHGVRGKTFQCALDGSAGPTRTLSGVLRAEAVQQIDLLRVGAGQAIQKVLGGIDEADWAKVQQVALALDDQDQLAWAGALLARHGYHCKAEPSPNPQAGTGAPQLTMLYARRAQVAKPLAAAAATRPGLSADTLKAQLRARLPAYMVPDVVMLLDAMPRTPNGKLDTRALPLPGQVAASAPVLPRSDQERTIAAIWHSVLGRTTVGVDDNFFESGGNSLLVVQVRTALQEAFAREISVVDLFRYPTIASLATFLASGGQDGANVASAGDRGAERRKRMASRNRAAA